MRGLVFPLTIIGLFVFFAIFAELVAPYPYALQNSQAPFHPPTRIHLFKEGKPTFPYVHPYKMEAPLFKVYEEDKSVSCRLRFMYMGDYGFKLLAGEEPC